MSTPPFAIRCAVPGDERAIADLIHGLALYEKMPEKCFATEENVRQQLFCDNPVVEVLLAVRGDETLGFALFFRSFSTWLVKPGMYLEDLFVKPEHRRQGIGGALLARLARICVERDYGRFEWSCLEWNELAKAQYRKAGAEPLDEWRVWRMEGGAIRRLAASAD